MRWVCYALSLLHHNIIQEIGLILFFSFSFFSKIDLEWERFSFSYFRFRYTQNQWLRIKFWNSLLLISALGSIFFFLTVQLFTFYFFTFPTFTSHNSMVIARWNYYTGSKSLRFSIPLLYPLLHHRSPKLSWVDTRTKPNLNSRSTKDDPKIILRNYTLPHRPTRSQYFNLFSEPIGHAHVAQPTQKSTLGSWAQYLTLMDEAQGSRLRKEKIWPQKSAPIQRP